MRTEAVFSDSEDLERMPLIPALSQTDRKPECAADFHCIVPSRLHVSLSSCTCALYERRHPFAARIFNSEMGGTPHSAGAGGVHFLPAL